MIRDLIVDMTQFFKQYQRSIAVPVNDTPPPEKERLQSPGRARRAQRPVRVHPVRELLRPAARSFWWNPDKFVGPAGLLQAYRFIADSRDQATGRAPGQPRRPYRLFRCHTISELRRRVPEGLESRPKPLERSRN